MKRKAHSILSILLSLSIVLCVSACGKDSDTKETTTAPPVETTEKVTEEIIEKPKYVDHNFGKVVSYKGDIYFWKYTKDGLFPDRLWGRFTEVNYNYFADGENELVKRSPDGKETVLLKSKSDGNIAISDDRLFYIVKETQEKETLSTCKLDGSDVKTLATGGILELNAVTQDTKGLIFTTLDENNDSKIYRIDLEKLNVFELVGNASFLVEHENKIYFEENKTDLHSTNQRSGKTTLSVINYDGSDKKVLHTTKADLPPVGPGGEYDGAVIYNPHIVGDYIFYSYGSIDGSGAYFQGGKIVKVKLDGSDAEVVAKTGFNGEHSLPGYLVNSKGEVSINKDALVVYVDSLINEPYIHDGKASYYNIEKGEYEDYILKSDYKDFSDNFLKWYIVDDIYDDSYYEWRENIVQVDFCERIGDEIYFMLSEAKDNEPLSKYDVGYRQSYHRVKSAMFKKDLTTGEVEMIYEF